MAPQTGFPACSLNWWQRSSKAVFREIADAGRATSWRLGHAFHRRVQRRHLAQVPGVAVRGDPIRERRSRRKTVDGHAQQHPRGLPQEHTQNVQYWTGAKDIDVGLDLFGVDN
jgi:hypothetical protein